MVNSQVRMTPKTMIIRADQTEKQSQIIRNITNEIDKLFETLKSEWTSNTTIEYIARYNKIRPSFQNAEGLLDEITHNLRESALNIILETKVEFFKK